MHVMGAKYPDRNVKYECLVNIKPSTINNNGYMKLINLL
jgi:hypothetical protein